MKILTISDKVEATIYSPALRQLFGDVDLVLGCGDLPYYYLEFIVTVLGGPLFYVIGNHANALRNWSGPKQDWVYPAGCVNLDGRVVHYRKLLIAGLEGSMSYNNRRDFQYTEREMAWKVWSLAPRLLLNRMLYGRYLDILITHAPPRNIHDREDLCHRGFQAFVTLMERFRPRYLIHGHVHVYHPNQVVRSKFRDTVVLNTYGHRTLEIDEATLR